MTAASETLYRDLYYSWERDQWAAGAIDLSADRHQWPHLNPELQDFVKRVVATSHLLAERSTELLVPFVDAAPTGEQQALLGLQVGLTHVTRDGARHVDFGRAFQADRAGTARAR